MTADAPRRVLVTGAEGFVGRHLVPALAKALPEAAIVPATFDVTDAAAIAHQVSRVQPDACVHLAAVSAVPTAADNPGAAWDVNLGGTLKLAAALASLPGCRLLFVGTADAYGRSFAAGAPLDEAAALNPMNVYGATKAAADLALGAMARDGLHIIRVRPFNHIGPGQSATFAVPAFARQIMRIAAGLQPPVLHVGALDPLRDFLDVRDVCTCYAQCLTQSARIESGTVLNIASGTPRRVGDVLDELLAIAGVQAEIAVDAVRLRPSEIGVASGDATRVRQLLGWSPTITWPQTLADILDDWRGRVGAERS